MKIFDRYIITNFVKYFLIIAISMQIICTIIDISQRMHRLYNNQSSLKDALIYYYPFWSIWLLNNFSPIILFISVILFTSKMTKNSEITTLILSGVSFFRLTMYYLSFAFIVGIITFLMNCYVIPIINNKKNNFYYQYLIGNLYKKKNKDNQPVIIQISKEKFFFIKKFYRKKKIGYQFIYEKFYKNKLSYILKSLYIKWDSKKRRYLLYNYNETYLKEKNDLFNKGLFKILYLPINPKNFYENHELENMKIYELNNFLKKDLKNRNKYLNEYNQRIVLPFSTLAFSILGFSIASKRNSDLSNNLITGIILIFLYIFLMEFIKTYIMKYNVHPSISWIPNILLIIVTGFYYWNRNNEI